MQSNVFTISALLTSKSAIPPNNNADKIVAFIRFSLPLHDGLSKLTTAGRYGNGNFAS